MTTTPVPFRSESLAGSLEAPRSDIPRGPADDRLRLLFARLLMLAGQWDDALSQLDAAASLDAEALRLAHTYRGLIHAEKVRAAVFAGHCSPGVIGGALPWLAQLVTCLSLERQGHTAWAAELRIDAFEVAPEVVGSINGAAFASIADADSRLGPVLEVIVGGSYYWAPFACIQHIAVERSRNAGQSAWLPAQLTWRSGERSTGFIPVRYPGSEFSDNEAIRLAQETQWQRIGEDCHAGLGQRLLRAGTDETGILDVRDVQLILGGSAAHARLRAAQDVFGMPAAGGDVVF